MEAEAGAAGTRAPEGKDADGPAREEAPEGKASSEGGDDGGKGGGGEGCGGDGSREHGNTKAARSTGKGSKAGKKAGGKLREKGGASEGCVDGQERHDWQRWHKFTPGKKVTPAHAARAWRPVRGPWVAFQCLVPNVFARSLRSFAYPSALFVSLCVRPPPDWQLPSIGARGTGAASSKSAG